MNTLCLQKQFSLTGTKGDSTWRLSHQFAQSVTSNKSSPQNLTLLGNKCGITPGGRNLRLTSVLGSQLVTQEHSVLTLNPSFLSTLQGSRYMLTARDNLVTRARDPFHQQLRSGEGQRGVWVQHFVKSVSERQCHSLPTVHNLEKEEMSFYQTKGITIKRRSRTLQYCNVDEIRGNQTVTIPENKIMTSECKNGCSSCGAFLTEKPS